MIDFTVHTQIQTIICGVVLSLQGQSTARSKQKIKQTLSHINHDQACSILNKHLCFAIYFVIIRPPEFLGLITSNLRVDHFNFDPGWSWEDIHTDLPPCRHLGPRLPLQGLAVFGQSCQNEKQKMRLKSRCVRNATGRFLKKTQMWPFL